MLLNFTNIYNIETLLSCNCDSSSGFSSISAICFMPYLVSKTVEEQLEKLLIFI